MGGDVAAALVITGMGVGTPMGCTWPEEGYWEGKPVWVRIPLKCLRRQKNPKDWNLGSWSKALCIGQSSPCWGWEELFGKKQSWFSKSSPATWQLSGPVFFGTSVGGVLSCTPEALSWFLGGRGGVEVNPLVVLHSVSAEFELLEAPILPFCCLPAASSLV